MANGMDNLCSSVPALVSAENSDLAVSPLPFKPEKVEVHQARPFLVIVQPMYTVHALTETTLRAARALEKITWIKYKVVSDNLNSSCPFTLTSDV